MKTIRLTQIGFREINVLKSVNKHYFGKNYKKVGKFSFLNI